VEKCPLRLSAGKASKAVRPSPVARRKLSGKRGNKRKKGNEVLSHPENDEISIQR
jgi:hypothetical protein